MSEGFNFGPILMKGKKNRDGIFNYMPNTQDSIPFLKALSEWPGFFDILPNFYPDGFRYSHSFHWVFDVLRHDRAFGRQIISKVLEWVLKNDPKNVETIFFDLFRAVMAAEIRFVGNYIPQNSHEERLTGHLLSETIFSLDLMEPTVRKKLFELYGEEINFDFHYADIATSGMEKNTGGDFALIVEVDLPDIPTFVRAFKFQAKKAMPPSARVDLGQLDVLSKENPEGSYYVFYNLDSKSMNTGRRPPLVVSARECQSQLDNKEKQKTATLNAKWIYEVGTPFSAFLALMAMQPDKEIGFRCNSLMEAARYIYHAPYGLSTKSNGWFESPSRLVVVSIGGSIPKHYSNPNSDEQNYLFRFPPIRLD